MAVNVCTCPKCGAYYNGDAYEKCPSCAKANKTAPRKSTGMWSFFSPKEKKPTASEPSPNAESNQEKKNNNKKIDINVVENQETTHISDSGETVGWRDAPNPPDNGQTERNQGQQESGTDNNKPSNQSNSATGENVPPVAIQNLGKTTSKYIKTSEGQTVESVVGWLVGVKGVYYGQCFTLKSGVNKVGRSDSMDIALLRDTSISRSIVVKIIYDSKKNEFNAMPGDSSSLCYIDNEALYERKTLAGFEEFEFGDEEKNKFVFVPLCGEQFHWKNYEE